MFSANATRPIESDTDNPTIGAKETFPEPLSTNPPLRELTPSPERKCIKSSGSTPKRKKLCLSYDSVYKYTLQDLKFECNLLNCNENCLIQHRSRKKLKLVWFALNLLSKQQDSKSPG